MKKHFLGMLVMLLGACGGPRGAAVDGGPSPGDGGPRADAFMTTSDGGGPRDAFVAPGTDAGVVEIDGATDMDGAIASDGGCTTIDTAYAIIEWTDVVPMSPSCSFFSSPLHGGIEFNLGELGQMTNATTLEIDGATFVANDTGFGRFVECPFGSGNPYRFTEGLTGTWEGGGPLDPSCASVPPVFRGTYSYSECQVLTNRLCEDTDCSITASVTITLVETPPPPPADAGMMMPDDTARCAADCAARRALTAGTTCIVGDTCESECATAIVGAGACQMEARELIDCTGSMEGALECVEFEGEDPFIAPTFFGPCQDQSDTYFGCVTRPEPSGMCMPPEPDTGTANEGEACTVNTDCVPGLYCDGPCDGPGTCAPQPVNTDCFTMPRVTACRCDGVTSTTCVAAVNGVRVASTGACASPDAGM